MKSQIPVLVVAGLCAVAGLTGCQSGARSGGTGARAAVAVDIAADVDDYTVDRVGVLSFSNTTGVQKADVARRYVYAALAQADRFFLTKEETVARHVQRSGAGPEYERLLGVWGKRRIISAPDLTEVCRAAGFDAMLTIEVSKWAEEKIDRFQEGSSTTSVELKMHLYAADGTLLWSGSSMKVGRSQPYNPEMHMRATQDGEAVLDESRIPDPPPIEPLAQELAREIAATIPDLRADADSAS